jgi:ribosomal-protein-serine acetyltransferase
MELFVRSWVEADAPALNRAVAESLDHLRPWMAWVAGEPRDETVRRAWIREAMTEEAAGGDRTFGYWLGDRVVGAGGLHRRIAANGLEIGYWVHAAFTRQGIAAAGARRLTEIAFAEPDVDHVEIHHDRANVVSGRVAERLGFTLIDEQDRPRKAPAEEGVTRVWRLSRW